MDLSVIIKEIDSKGSTFLGKCSRSTLYRWAQNINEKLRNGNYNWRVEVNTETWCIVKK